MDQIWQTILKNTYSTLQLKQRLRILREHLSYQFFGGHSPQLTPEDMVFLDSLPKEFSSFFNKANLNDILSQLTAKINSSTPLTLYLAFEPTDEALTAIGEKARGLFGKDLLLDIKYNPNLLAGAAISWKGIYKDYSLKATIESRKQEILQSFKKFLR